MISICRKTCHHLLSLVSFEMHYVNAKGNVISNVHSPLSRAFKIQKASFLQAFLVSWWIYAWAVQISYRLGSRTWNFYKTMCFHKDIAFNSSLWTEDQSSKTLTFSSGFFLEPTSKRHNIRSVQCWLCTMFILLMRTFGNSRHVTAEVIPARCTNLHKDVEQ